MAAKSIQQRQLGKDGPSVPAMGFGLMTIAGAHGDAPSEEEQFQILDRAAELGNTFWDTSEYGPGSIPLWRNAKPVQYLL
jgi:aryl-alcohol dehydrogenase-like predicted oxidoreductase